MEHLSRRTTRDVDHLIIVSDPTQRGIVAARRIASFRTQFDINIKDAHIVLNRTSDGIHPILSKQIEEINVPLLGTISNDKEIEELDLAGVPLIQVGIESNIYRGVESMLSKILE